MNQEMVIPQLSTLSQENYTVFLADAFNLFSHYPQYLCANEGVGVLELAHLFPRVPETLLAIYIGINDAVCNKGLVTPFLPRHAHNNVFVFAP